MVALASRDRQRAERAASALGIPRAYDSYDALLADPDVEVVYIPLPNHLHVEWTIRAAMAGKHVLCEKPITLDAADALRLIGVRDQAGVKIQEAFMVRSHPQWLRARDLVRSGAIGQVRAMHTIFCNMNRNPENIRNILKFGGGALYDLGSYPVTMSRFIFEAEPRRVFARIERDPEFGTDIIDNVILDFASGSSSFICSTQMSLHQQTQIYGTDGRIEIEIPFAAPPDRPTRIFIDRGGQLSGTAPDVEILPTCNQYLIQAELFSQAIRGLRPQSMPLEESVANMRVIDAIWASAASGRWESVPA